LILHVGRAVVEHITAACHDRPVLLVKLPSAPIRLRSRKGDAHPTRPDVPGELAAWSAIRPFAFARLVSGAGNPIISE
jgi:hypothetical protein